MKPIIRRSIVLHIFFQAFCVLGAWAVPSEEQSLARDAVVIKTQLEQMMQKADHSFHQTVKKSYIGYLGLRGEDLLQDQELLNSAETLFTDLNHLLEENVEPIIRTGKQLSGKFFETIGDRSYLDKFTLQELRVRGLIFSNAEEFERGRQQLLQAVTLARKIDGGINAAYALNNLAYCDFHLNRPDEALENQRQAVELAEKMGNPSVQGLFLYNLGWIYLNRRDIDSAAPIFEKAAMVSELNNNRVHQAAALINLAVARFYQGHLAEARADLVKSLEVSRKINSLRYRAMAGLNYAIVLALEDRFAEAAGALEEPFAIFEKDGKRVFMNAERLLLEQKAAQLLDYINEQAPGVVGPAALARVAASKQTTETGTLHTHFAHLTATLLPNSESSGEESSSPPQAAGNKQAVRVTMKAATTPPNTTFSTPVYLSVPPGLKVGSLTLEITYPTQNLSLAKVEEGFQLQKVRATLETKTSAHPTDAKLKVASVTVTSGEEAGVKSPLPNGLILYVSFSVPQKATHGLVPVQNKILRAETIDGLAVGKEQLVAENQTMTILKSNMVPVIICFFYMH